jgi:hypothetical protein
MPTPVVANPKRRRFMPWTLTIAALAMLMAGCNPPYPMLKDADRASVSEATIRVGETFTVYATADSGSEFPFNYAWSSSDPDVVGFESREELGAYSQRAVVIGRAPGTAVVTYGQFASGGQPGERSDSMTFTVQPSTPTLTLEPSAAGWVSTPEVDLSAFSTVRLQLEFLVDGFEDEFGYGEFFGDFDGRDPAAELQLSASGEGDIGATTLSATFATFPSGSRNNGDSLRWDVTIDLSSWPAGATQFSVRPDAGNLGTAISSYLTLESSTVTVTP